MITFEEALEIVNKSVEKLESTEFVDIHKAVDRILATDVFSDVSMPPFNKSAVDGFACRREDMHKTLEVIENIPAGKSPKKKISAGQCSRIMTGAEVPEGSDMVVMIEYTETDKNGRIIIQGDHPKSNYALMGEDIKKGDQVLEKGQLLKPEHIAILAGVGCTRVEVYSKASVGIISTGNELVSAYEKPDKAQIRESNSYQLYAQALACGSIPKNYGIVSDDPDALSDAIKKALNENRIVLLTGGVSLGDYDFVPDVVEKLGARILFHQLKLQPGKPSLFATTDDKYIFGLPGNPVSSFLQFHLFVKTLIMKLMGKSNYRQKVRRLPLGQDFERKSISRMALFPGLLQKDGTVIPLEYHGSAHIHAYKDAELILSMPIGIRSLKKGDYIDVRFL
jgi:molybdopterin molybdotransferase